MAKQNHEIKGNGFSVILKPSHVGHIAFHSANGIETAFGTYIQLANAKTAALIEGAKVHAVLFPVKPATVVDEVEAGSIIDLLADMFQDVA